MLQLRRSSDRGHADHGWLESYHTFSFGEYRDENFMGFSQLRVLNQDVVAAGQGFPTHAHRDMEIVSYVLDGVLAHNDSMGNGSKMRPGEVQLMSAGTGVTHSEFNASDKETLHFLQMWVLPLQRGTEPRYDQAHYGESERRQKFRLVVSPTGEDGSLTIGQDVKMYAGLLGKGEQASLKLSGGRDGWLHVARGSLRCNGVAMESGDALAVMGERSLVVDRSDQAEFVYWDLPQMT